jgi:hypothetical protein
VVGIKGLFGIYVATKQESASHIFFEGTHDGIHIDFQDPGSFSEPNTIDHHLQNLRFDPGVICSVGVGQLKAARALLTSISLMAGLANTLPANLLRTLAIAT